MRQTQTAMKLQLTTRECALAITLDHLPGDNDKYFHAKAQRWIKAALKTRDSNDDWGVVEEAVGQVAANTTGLERAEPLSAENPALRIVSTVGRGERRRRLNRRPINSSERFQVDKKTCQQL